MTRRSAFILVGGGAFVVTFMLCGGHAGLWRRPTQAATAPMQAAPQPLARRTAAANDDLPAARPAVLAPLSAAAAAAATVSAPTVGSPADTSDSGAPPVSEREAAERQREDTRGGRTH